MLRKLLPYFIQGISVGIIIGLAVILFTRLDPFNSKPVVEIKQAATTSTNYPVSTVLCRRHREC